MTTEIIIALIFGAAFMLAVIKTAINEALRHGKPTTINHGTIIHHHYEAIEPQNEKQTLPSKIEAAARLLGEIRNDLQPPPE